MLEAGATYARSRLMRHSATRRKPAGERPGRTRNDGLHRPEGRGMLHPIRAAARVIDQRIGWNRIGLALSLVILVTAAIVLYRILSDIALADVVEAVKSTEWIDVLLATLFVTAGYFTLTFYDQFA